MSVTIIRFRTKLLCLFYKYVSRPTVETIEICLLSRQTIYGGDDIASCAPNNIECFINLTSDIFLLQNTRYLFQIRLAELWSVTSRIGTIKDC